ncbi:MAG: MmcQ/YjbR family DNA-binding protein [Acidobacteriota bacterium]|nr:MmcQ/YjbR family DNA-binding protein [Acidobacteriota bacterium]
MADARFTAVLLEGHKGAAFEVPFDPADRWDIAPVRLQTGRSGHRVAGKVNGVAFESAVVPRSRKFWVLIDETVREQARLEIGSTAKIALRPIKPVVKPAGDPDAALALVRNICLSLPETEEKIAWGAPTFRVHGRLFVMFANDHHGDGRIAAWCAAPPGAQQDLVAADPKHFFVPPYVGVGGWLGIRLDTKLSKGAIAALIEQGYRTIAEKRAASKRRRR